ncbi:hypothetical protein ABPG72_017541 [Tetrahymena utriculariae]
MGANIIFFYLITGLLVSLKCVQATNCQNLLSQLATPKEYYGYECIMDISNNFEASYITCTKINNDCSMADTSIQQGKCNQQQFIILNQNGNCNDVLVCINVNQNLAKVQISYDQYFYKMNNIFPSTLGLVVAPQSGVNYLDRSDIAIDLQKSNLQCQADQDYYKIQEQFIININPTTTSLQILTYVHPGTFPNLMANVQIMAYYQCPIGCSQCDNQGKCSACIQGYSINNQYCYLNCNNSNQYALVDVNSSQQSCQQCDPSCLTCFSTSKSCTACANSYYPLYTPPSTTFNCYMSCPDNYYLENSQCKQCDQSCLTCSVSSNVCTNCSNGYYPLYVNPPSSTFQCYQTCPNNYYLSDNQCLLCDISCSNCSGDSKSCTSCSNSYYPLYNGSPGTPFQCYQTCPDSYYLSNNQCLKCDQPCATCQVSSNACKSCTNSYYPLYSIPPTATFQCYQSCPNNYYLSTDQCLQCDASCSTCITDSKSCTSCSNTYYPLYTNQPNSPFTCYQTCPNNYYLSNNQCEQCDQSCSTCSGNSNTCTSCSNGFYPLITGQVSPTFLCYQICPNNYFLKDNQCQKCDTSCSTCTGDSKSCTSCSNGYIPLYDQPSQNVFLCYSLCPNGYELQQNQCQKCVLNYNTKQCQSCSVACNSCQLGQTTNCLDCYPSMDFNNNKCTCKNSQDSRNIFYQCSYENVAVIQATFAGNSPTLTLEFGSILKSVNGLLCSDIFDDITLSLLGSSSNCAIRSTQIVVSLSSDALIMVNSTLGLNQQAKALKFQDYSLPIDTFYLMPVTQQLVATPSVNILYSTVQNSCNDISFTIQKIQNDANRGFMQLKWVLDQPKSLDASTLQKVNSIINQANQQQSYSLVFSKYTLPPDYSITIQLFYLLKVNQSNTLSFTTYNQFSKQLNIQSVQSKYPPIYRYMDLVVQLQFFVQICNQSGPVITQEPLDIQIDSKLLPNLSQVHQKFNSEYIQLAISAYSIPQSLTLDLQVQASLSSNNSISSTQSLSITPQLSKLFIDIYGGSDRLVDYKSDYILIGLARDYEIKDPSLPQGIQLSWSCYNLAQSNGDNQCYNYLKQVYIMPQNVQNVTIIGGTFNPYQSLKFNLTGQKDTRTSWQSIFIIFAEIDLPPLYVQFDDPSQMEQVNINDDISATLVYGSSVPSNILTYAGAVLYNNNVVGIIKFDYYKVKLRIWDYFSNINWKNPVVQVRFTVYNPANIMPSLSTINLNINIPPQQCVLSVSPANGQALQTQFTLSFQGCTTKNSPLTYQFFYFNQLSDQQLEIQIPQNILRRQIQDQTANSQLRTILPSGNLIIIGQAMDSYLAVYNQTVQVNVVSMIQDEQSLLNLVDQAISSSFSTTVSNSILNLCVIAEELSKNNPVYKLPSINQRKIDLIQNIFSKSSQLSSTSFLSTFSNKVIAQLQQSLVIQQDQQISSTLNQVNQALQNQQQLINNKDFKLLKNNDVVLQNLVDSFKIINSTTTNFNVNNTSQNYVQTQMNISDQIGNILNSIALPNQGEFQMQGNQISLSCEQITQKNLQKYIYDEDNIVSNDTSTYNVVITNYAQNPFYQTPSFQAYLNQLKNSTDGIQISSNPVIKPFIQNTNINLKSNLQEQYQLQFPSVQKSKYNLTCLQQQSSTWSTQMCTTIKSKYSGGFNCICQSQSPTTIIEDLNSILNNKNLQTAFGSQGIQNITNFNYFYEYAVFWILSSVTLIQIGLCWFGKKLDQKSLQIIFRSQTTVFPMSQLNIGEQNLQKQQIQEKLSLQNEPQQSNNNQLEEQSNQQSLQQDQQLIDLEKLQKSQLTPAMQIQNLTDKEMNEIIKWNINQEYDTQSARKKEINLEAKSNKTIQILQTINDNQSNQNIFQDRLDKQKIQQTKIDNENSSQKRDKFLQNTSFDQKIIDQENTIKKDDDILQKLLQKSTFYQILIFHNFFSIFFVNDQQLSRPLRFTVYYLRVIHSLSISTIFNQQENIPQIVIVSIINATIIVVSVAIIQAIYKLRKLGQDKEIKFKMFPFIKRICVETLQDCLMMKKSHNNIVTPHAKQSIQVQDDEKRKMANNVDQDDNLENDQDDDQFSTDWTTAPSTNNMVVAYDSLNREAVPPSQNKQYTKQSNQKEENMQKPESQNQKKVTKMLGKLDEEMIKTKQQDLLDEEPDYFEDLNKQQQELVFQEPVVNKQKQQENLSNEKGRFQDDGALEDFNANGWVEDIEIEL